MNHIETGFDCWCNPKIEIIDGNMLIVHHDVLLVRKKPVEVTAKRWDGTKESFEELLTWNDEKFYLESINPPYHRTQSAPNFWNNYKLVIFTLEGVMTANAGDYIVRGVNGEFYPCKHDIFHKTYDIVKDKP